MATVVGPPKEKPPPGPRQRVEATGQGAHGRGQTGEAGRGFGRGRDAEARRSAEAAPRGSRSGALAPVYGLGRSGGCDCARLPSASFGSSCYCTSFAVWIQGPVIAFTCGRRKDRLRKTGLAEGMGEKVRKGGQLQRDSSALHELLTPPQTLRWDHAVLTGVHSEGRCLRIHEPEAKAREEAYELRKELALWASPPVVGAHPPGLLCSLPKRHRFCSTRGSAVIPTLSRRAQRLREEADQRRPPRQASSPGLLLPRERPKNRDQLP